MQEKVDCIVIGAGVIGLAVARRLALSGREVVLVEAESAVGTHTSSRNSEVIHAGIYYPEGSLKAQLCRLGRDMLYDYCAERGVTFKQYGKLIVATDKSQYERLANIYATGLKNDIADLSLLSSSKIKKIAPALNAFAAIKSPSTGVVDSHQLMLALLGDFENAGGTLALNASVVGGASKDDVMYVDVAAQPEITLVANHVVNCAGLWATKVAHSIDGMPTALIPAMHYAKGSYFAYTGKPPCDTLVYPIPFVGGLGIHLTLDVGGGARFGPDIEWVDGVDYALDDSNQDRFLKAIQTYWPDVDPSKLSPSYAGVRPKIVTPDVGDQDFCISGPSQHGIAGLYHMFGFDSPGLTSCLAIADYLGRIIMGRYA